MRVPLTKRQLEIYDFIRQYIEVERVSPTYKEIGRGCNTTAENAHRLVMSMQERGALYAFPARQRGILLTEERE